MISLNFTACDTAGDPDAPDEKSGASGNGEGEQISDAITCAEAKEIALALTTGETSDEEYIVVGYITDVFANISNNQQSFWIDDNKGSTQTVQAYWANLPEGVSTFVRGSKVSIKGKLMNFDKNGTAIAEMKNPTVTILEEGDDEPVGEGTVITCAQAKTEALKLAEDATGTTLYTVVGYISVISNKGISRNQQWFWMDDTKGSTTKTVQAFWANIPEPYTELPVGTKVRMTGYLMNYKGSAEMKNGTVTIVTE